jgi:small GTP-binding protein
MSDDTNLLFKVVIIGDSGVGKSNLMTRYTSNDFSAETPPTIGVEFMTKQVRVEGRDAKVQIWDTAGQERFRAISRSIYHGAKGAMLVYDITNQQSFDSIPTWLQELRVHVHATTVIFLIGNKCDLEHLRVVKKETADRFAREHNLSFLETSALEKTNVEKAFDWLVKSIYEVTVSGPGGSGGGGGQPASPATSGGKKGAPQPVKLAPQPAAPGKTPAGKKCSC